MEAVVLIGIQASGKTTFFRDRFFDSHIRLSLDMLRTRHRERLLLDACIAAKQAFVVDNTNPTRAERSRYIEAAKAGRFRTIGYFFEPNPRAAAARNRRRPEEARIPPAGLFGTLKNLERPEPGEGFDELYVVDAKEGRFDIRPYPGV
jgi:predicted kinase